MQTSDKLISLLKSALEGALKDRDLDFNLDENFDFGLERPKDDSHGDFACTLALRLAKQLHMAPREIAQLIVDNFPENDLVNKIEIAGPGFINLYLSETSISEIIDVIRKEGLDFAKGCAADTDDASKKINLEYISANPTGPMHVGHGRWAALGQSMALIMKHDGMNVYQEFYLNDHGVQMNLFANSIVVRYLQELGQDADMPDDSYGGAYVTEIAKGIIEEDGDKWKSADESERLAAFREIGMNKMVEEIQSTLNKFGNKFDLYFSESSLYESDPNKVEEAIEKLKSAGLIYERDNATWFKTSEFGDDKDRVIIKENGDYTYFISDCAYHLDKLNRGFDHLIDIWGADHHGYIPRMKAMMQAWGRDADDLEVVLGQLVNLFRDGKPVRMSKRTGEMVTFQELIDEVGVDATRYLMLSRNSDQPIDFDIELAKKQDSSNPVYYVQYAHARISSIIRNAGEMSASADLSLLSDKFELDLCRLMSQFPELVRKAALNRTPHVLVHYSQDLAGAFHQFYTNCRVIDAEENLKNARLALCDATRILLELTLSLLGVSAPEKM